jgi:hypothetical protein
MSKTNETGAHQALADTARMRGLDALRDDPLELTQPLSAPIRRHRAWEGKLLGAQLTPRDPVRERRKPSTVGERQPLVIMSRKVSAAEAQRIWPPPTALASSDPDGHRQAFVDYISDQGQPL